MVLVVVLFGVLVCSHWDSRSQKTDSARGAITDFCLRLQHKVRMMLVIIISLSAQFLNTKEKPYKLSGAE